MSPLAAYLLFGALHEFSHVLAAWSMSAKTIPSWGNLLSVILERRVVIDIDHHDATGSEYKIRHFGWIFSVILALIVCFRFGRSSSTKMAAIVTALEAMATDLFGFHQCLCLANLNLPTSMSVSSYVFYCGNFGIILMHHWWLTNKGKLSAMDCLEQMVNVTMMRGAQSGGVVTYTPSGEAKKDMKAVRTRVVNRKRTDLSKQIRSKVQRTFHPSETIQDTVLFAGHTRFATSSKASLDGTHPHRWTPGSFKRVYSWSTNQIERRWVENYITHNGDFDFYTIQEKTHDLESIQNWLSLMTETKTPAVVDSCAIAGMIDILRTKGCFGLAIRYAICFGDSNRPTARGTAHRDSVQECLNNANNDGVYPPTYNEFESLGMVFETVLESYMKENQSNLKDIENSITSRIVLSRLIHKSIIGNHLHLIKPFAHHVDLSDVTELDKAKSYDLESFSHSDSRLFAFCMATVNAFFDNDLFQATKEFLKNAKGSFGLSTSSTLDSKHQICLAARGQTISIAFYPEKKLVCFGSEQAATKAGMNANYQDDHDGGVSESMQSTSCLDSQSMRLDLDDLGGEIVVLDWGCDEPVSKPNRHLTSYLLMNSKLRVVLHQESKSTSLDREIFHRMTQLSGNQLIKPLSTSEKSNTDLILKDIQDIPKVCKDIQRGWHSLNATTSLNRLTAFSLSLCLRSRLKARVKGTIPGHAIDILLTGCEVSLWLAEQFAADLQKSFPRLNIKAVSSNKLLGLYGQELAVPAIGFQESSRTSSLDDTIVIIVSHSGGTFAPLACSNLLQSTTNNIFVVTSEWDTQIGKQLRSIDNRDDNHSILRQRIFTTELGIRPAEPCSVSVAATHQLLTNLFLYISIVILSDPTFCRVTAATITEQDVKVLERCNQMNIEALAEVTGSSIYGFPLDRITVTQKRLIQAANLWAEHVLENARAYIMTFVYIFVTVTLGYPLVYAIALGLGLDMEGSAGYVCRFLDSLIYFWLPQINIIMIRLWQGRDLRHRMVGRTVVIGDIPWVAQCAEAFLSKIFAVSYSIAGVNVLSGNPTDHFVHRHTHRVVRGTLTLFGRPDGRLSALSTAEASVCLSVNQASSIQSWGGTCESITIGHNPFKLDLSKNGIFLKRHRPLFLCERLLVEQDANQENEGNAKRNSAEASKELTWRKSCMESLCCLLCSGNKQRNVSYTSLHHALDCSISLKQPKKRSAPALLGAYLNIEEDQGNKDHRKDPYLEPIQEEEAATIEGIVSEAISKRKWSSSIRRLFQSLDVDRDGFLNREEFIGGLLKLKPEIGREEAEIMFREADVNQNLSLSLNEFTLFLDQSGFESSLKVPKSHRDRRGIIQIEASGEKYFGEDMRKLNAASKLNDMDFVLARGQHLSQELYESRIASLQRFVSMTVLFHQMGKRVENFFARISLGFWSYRMDRTHSIMRIATTASPISGADVRNRIEHLRLLRKVQRSVDVISTAYLAYKERQMKTQRLQKH